MPMRKDIISPRAQLLAVGLALRYFVAVVASAIGAGEDRTMPRYTAKSGLKILPFLTDDRPRAPYERLSLLALGRGRISLHRRMT